jgi:hypothetical protein
VVRVFKIEDEEEEEDLRQHTPRFQITALKSVASLHGFSVPRRTLWVPERRCVCAMFNVLFNSFSLHYFLCPISPQTRSMESPSFFDGTCKDACFGTLILFSLVACFEVVDTTNIFPPLCKTIASPLSPLVGFGLYYLCA